MYLTLILLNFLQPCVDKTLGCFLYYDLLVQAAGYVANTHQEANTYFIGTSQGIVRQNSGIQSKLCNVYRSLQVIKLDKMSAVNQTIRPNEIRHQCSVHAFTEVKDQQRIEGITGCPHNLIFPHKH